MYHDVVLWMMKRDLLVVLHLRVRIVATMEVKVRVREMRERWIRKRERGGRIATSMEEKPERLSREAEAGDVNVSGGVYYDFRNGPGDGIYRDRNTTASKDAADNNGGTDSEDADEAGELGDGEDSGWDSSLEEGGDVNIGNFTPSIIFEPGKATPLERRWLTAMSAGKDPEIVRRFEL